MPQSRRSKQTTVLCVAAGLGLTVFAATSVSLALPGIQGEFNASGAELQWVVNLFVLVTASLIVAGGGFADTRGRKGVLLIGVACFGLGSLVCAAAPSLGVLMLGRVVSGVGPAMMVPAGLSILTATFLNPRERAAAIGIWSGSAGLAATLGPPVGGLLVDGFGWRSVFLVNVPFSLALIVVSALVLTRLPRERADASFDGVGALLAGISLFALCSALIEGRELGWGSPTIIGLSLVFAAGLVAFARWERRHHNPLVDLNLFRIRGFVVAALAAFTGFFSFMVMPVFLSLYFPLVGGLSPVATGLRLLPLGVMGALGAIVGGRLNGRFGPRWPLAAGMATCGLGLLFLVRLGTEPPSSPLLWELILIGFGSGLALTAMTTATVNAVKASQVGAAAAVHNSVRQVGFVLGVAVLGAILYGSMDAKLSSALARADVPPARQAAIGQRAEAGLPLPAAGEMSSAQVEAEASAAFVTGLQRALVAAALPALAAAIAIALLLGRARTSDELALRSNR